MAVGRVRRGRALAARCALVVALSAAGASAQDAGALARGRASLDADDWASARPWLEEATRSGDPLEAGEASYFLGLGFDTRLAFPEALAAYRASVARAPGSRWAGRALARIEDLEAHAEGGFEPLRALERVRRAPSLASDPAALAALERACAGFPPGPVRAEARLLVGEAYLGRLARPRDAARVFLALAGDPSGPESLRALGASRLVTARARLGEAGRGLREVESVHAEADIVRTARTLARRAVLHRVAWGALGFEWLVGALSVVRALTRGAGRALWRAWRRPLPLAHLAMLSLGGALLARAYDGHDGGPFYLLGVGGLLVYLAAAAWGVAGSARAWARGLRAVACALAALAVSYLTMEALDPRMLEGIWL